MSIKPTDYPDFNLLSALHGVCFSPGWSREALLDLFLNNCTWAFVAPDKSGFGIVRIIGDEAEILTIAVSPKHQRNGTGRNILGSMLGYARDRGVKSVFLEVREGNGSARRLYETSGFSVISRRRNYYQSPQGVLEDAVVMRRQM